MAGPRPLRGCMTHRFGRFELDEERRELRLDGRELLLQPRVFDLLAYLIRHREKVVAKDELLEALWPGVIVADGALQRAVSLARSALRHGGGQDTIRTFSRQGYRFCGEVTHDPGPEPSAVPMSPVLERARKAYDECSWEDAAGGYRQADAGHPLGALDLERWAMAETCLGRGRDAVPPMERASAAHAAAGDARGSARAALFLTQVLFEQLQLSVARGWHRRAQSLLEDLDPSPEHGHLEWLRARLEMMEGDQEAARDHSSRAIEIGRSLGDADVETLGILYRGHARLSLGDITGGQADHDEAAAAVLAGSVTPWVGGLTYCSVIWACRNRGDWERAAQWSDHFVRWCERSGMARYPGTCMLHQAEVLSMQGKLERAEEEVRIACETLPATAPWAHGDAWRVLGDLLLARGELDEAGRSYKQAHALGWDPNPGHAVLTALRGDARGAVRSLERSLTDRSWTGCQRRELLLCHLAVVASQAGDLEKARAALARLDEGAGQGRTISVKAWRARAEGEFRLAEGRAREAAGSFRQALAHWREAGIPLHAAEVRFRLAAALEAEGDAEAAELETAAAREFCGRLGLPAPREGSPPAGSAPG